VPSCRPWHPLRGECGTHKLSPSDCSSRCHSVPCRAHRYFIRRSSARPPVRQPSRGSAAAAVRSAADERRPFAVDLQPAAAALWSSTCRRRSTIVGREWEKRPARGSGSGARAGWRARREGVEGGGGGGGETAALEGRSSCGRSRRRRRESTGRIKRPPPTSAPRRT